MSTILKALRRLESERATPTDGRPLREAVAAAEPLSPAPERRRWAPLASLVVGVAVGATALLLWPRAEPSPPAALEVQTPELAASAPPSRGTGAAHAPRSAPVAATPAREIDAPSPAGPPPQAFASEVAIVPRPVPTPRLVDPPPTELALAAGPSSALVDSSPDLQPRSVARTDPKPERAPAVPEESAPEPAAARAVPPSDEPAPPAPSPKRELASASGAPNGRTEPSKIRVEKTLWHPQADRRVAVVTLPGHEGPLRVREGEVVGEVLVSKIEPSGVVFTGERGDVRRAVGAR